MKTTEILSKRKWRHHLTNRKYMGLFLIPRDIWPDTKVRDGSKRRLLFEFDTGIRLRGTASITSGTEISIPKHLQHYFEEAKWFDCEIIDNTLYEKVTLDIY